jgi:hypothetical protein
MDRSAVALRIFELDEELRVDRVPELSPVEWRARYDERARLMASLGWRPNEGKNPCAAPPSPPSGPGSETPGPS